MKNAIITGSETFGKYITNPTKYLALSANGKVISGYKIHSLLFPSVVYVPEGSENPGETIVRKAKEIGANAIISFGMSSGVKGLQLERTGTNWIYNEKYLTASENNRPLDNSRKEKERIQAKLSHWDLGKMKALFTKAKIPFEADISDDAGGYSCNSWIYRTLIAMKRQRLDISYLFVHTPCTKEAIELMPEFDKNKTLIKKEDLLKALEIILQCHKD